MRGFSSGEVIGYFWILVVLGFIAFAWIKLGDYLYKDEICILQSAFTCQEKQLFIENGHARVKMKVQNNLGRWIQVTGFSCSSETPDPSLGYPKRGFEEMKMEVLPDAQFEVSSVCIRPASEKQGSHFGGLAYIRYEYRDEPYVPGSSIAVGNIRGDVRG